MSPKLRKKFLSISFAACCALCLPDTAHADFGKIKWSMTREEIEAQFYTFNSDMLSLNVSPNEINVHGTFYNIIKSSDSIKIIFMIRKKITRINYISVASKLDFYELRLIFIKKFGRPDGEGADGYAQNCNTPPDVACINSIGFYDKTDRACIMMAWPDSFTEKQLLERRGIPSAFDISPCDPPKPRPILQ